MPINGKPTYYEFFGLDNFEADQVKIKKAYRKMALKWHPDRCEDKITGERMFKQVNEINVVLSTKKESYDRYLRNKIGGSESATSQTSADAWSTQGPFNFDFESMMRAARRAEMESGFYHDMLKQSRIDSIANMLNGMTGDQIKEVENYINFIKRK